MGSCSNRLSAAPAARQPVWPPNPSRNTCSLFLAVCIRVGTLAHMCVIPVSRSRMASNSLDVFFFFFRSTLKNHLAFGSRLMRAASFVKPCVKGGELLKSFGKTGKRPAGCRRRRLPSDPCTTPNKQREKGWREREARCNI